MNSSTPFVLSTGVLLSAVLLVEPALSQESAAEPKDGHYVLRLEDGSVLRGRARVSGERVEVRRDGEWIELAPGAVERATLEADLLRESRRLERAAGKDPVLAVAHAQWCLEQGLVAEGLAGLDRVLERDPDQAAARDLLRREDAALALSGLERDGEPRALLALAASGGPAVREVALQRVAKLADLGDVRAELGRSLVERSPRTRAFAALGLRRLFPGEELPALLGRAVLDASADVRSEAARGLRDAGDPSVVAPLVRAMGSKSSAVRLNAIEALALVSEPAAVEPLYDRLVALQQGGATRSGAPRSHVFVGRQFAFVQDYDVEVSQNAAIADPVINVGLEGAMLEGAVLGVHDYVVQTERAALRSALSRLTGADPGKTTQAWMRWWNEHGNEWLALANQGRDASYPSSRER